ncbi:MAG: cytochrome c biogenesis protein CcsA [Desulfurococcales archaeon]|nr:cytochrome c biogenesis protein CcsA [Desulfurococcales archaeon]
MGLHYTGYPYLIGAAAAPAAGLLCYRSGGGRRWINAWRAGLLLVIVAWIPYIWAYVIQDYTLLPVYEYSGRHEFIYRLASSWAGGGGSLAALASVYSLIILLLSRRRVNGVLLASSGLMVLALVTLALENNAFTYNSVEAYAGAGLNPLLQSPWIYPHPLATFLAYSSLLAAVTALVAGDLRGRLVALVAWSILSLSLLLGGVWSYESLGWGGYWAWDPVEVSELVPWLLLTAALHAFPVDRRAGQTLLYMSAAGVFLALLVTRAGLSELHGFASPAAATVTVAGAGFLVFLVLALRDVEALRVLAVFDRRRPYWLGVKVSSLSLFYMGLVTLAIMLWSTVGVLLGRIGSAPTGDSGIRVYHPLLAPALLALLVAMPLSMLGERLKWDNAVGLLASGTASSIALSLLGYLGRVVVSPKSSLLTNIYILVVLPWTGIALAASLMGIARFFKRNRLVAARLAIHFFTAVLVLGLLVSGPYSYNSSYYTDTRLKVGDELVLDGVRIKLLSYEYRLQEGVIDAYTPYAGRSPIFYAGSVAPALLVTGLDEAYQEAVKGLEELKRMGLLGLLDGIHGQGHLEVYNPTISLPTGNVTSNGTYQVVLENATGLLLIRPGEEPNVTLQLVVVGDVLVSPTEGLEGARYLEGPSRGSIKLGDLTVNVTGASVTLVSHGTGQAPAGGPAYRVRDSMLSINGSINGVNLPAVLSDEAIYYVGLFRSNEYTMQLFRFLNETRLGRVLLDGGVDSFRRELFPANCTWPETCLGYPPTPTQVAEGAILKLTFQVESGRSVTTKTIVQRFELNGELQGVRGLVATPLVVRLPTADVYLEVYPPLREGYHELIVYYLHSVSKELDPTRAFSLASVLAAANLYDQGNPNYVVQLAMNQPAQMLHEALTLYTLSEHFDPDNSSIATEGLYIRAKIVPGIRLVWIGGAGLFLTGIATAVITGLSSRRGGESSEE